MDNRKYIGMDVHQASISIAVSDTAGKVLMESIIETKAATVLEFIQGLRGSLSVTLGWQRHQDAPHESPSVPLAADGIGAARRNPYLSHDGYQCHDGLCDGAGVCAGQPGFGHVPPLVHRVGVAGGIGRNCGNAGRWAYRKSGRCHGPREPI
jgi:hypothetical protein